MEEKSIFSSIWTWVLGIPAAVGLYVFGDKHGWFNSTPEPKTDGVTQPAGTEGADKTGDQKAPPQSAIDSITLAKNDKNTQKIYVNADGKFIEKPEIGSMEIEGIMRGDKFEVQSFGVIDANGSVTPKYKNFANEENKPSFKLTINDLAPIPSADGLVSDIQIDANEEQSKKTMDYLRKNWAGQATAQDLSAIIEKKQPPELQEQPTDKLLKRVNNLKNSANDWLMKPEGVRKQIVDDWVAAAENPPTINDAKSALKETKALLGDVKDDFMARAMVTAERPITNYDISIPSTTIPFTNLPTYLPWVTIKPKDDQTPAK